MGQQYSHLSSEERILIEKLHCEQHLSIRRTAERIGRDKSTVSRELRRVCVQLVVAGLVTMIFRV
ncbi:Transposase [Bifidobacterium longum]|nr:Transposase [Bifidobacterium longum]PKD08761.1 Transposase [Bifidobacterium longum]